jgi:hypothetical protein
VSLAHTNTWVRPVLRLWSAKVKHDVQERFGNIVAKRLTKALRGKRRWIGVAFSPSVQARSDAEAIVEALKTNLAEPNLRLMDFIPANQRPERCVVTEATLERAEDEGLGVLRVPLPAYQKIRSMLESDDWTTNGGVHSLTASGKIRLVRERLGLPKPARR